MELSKEDQLNFFNLKKGYEGEKLFDTFLEKLECDVLVLNDLLLSSSNQTFQLDTLLVTNNLVYIFEIKNYFGDFYFKNDRLFQKNDNEVSNPLNQLQRSELLLRQLLHKLGFSIPVQSMVIFINEAFTLYLAPLDKPFILPTQLKTFFQKINSHKSTLDMQHKKMAEKLSSLHMQQHPHQKRPSYNNDQLQTGMSCGACQSLTITIQNKKSICTTCKNEESIDSALIRNANEYSLLFPNEKITLPKIMDWCRIITSKKQLRRVLDNNYQKVSKRRWTYYE
ncbi:nuclease-related domain-containing protein [Lysinibacillus yapensis]|nr:nuclease-related domain-containing protein [Lysinibacillus yapensis]